MCTFSKFNSKVIHGRFNNFECFDFHTYESIRLALIKLGNKNILIIPPSKFGIISFDMFDAQSQLTLNLE